MCYVDHLLRHDFQGQTHLVFGKKKKMKKTGERKRRVIRQNRRSDGDQGTGIPKTPKGEKV